MMNMKKELTVDDVLQAEINKTLTHTVKIAAPEATKPNYGKKVVLLRQVIGEEIIDKADAEVKHLGFYRRYERWNLPVIVMTIGMLIVAYTPLFFYAK